MLQDRGEECYGEKRKLTEKMMENEEREKEVLTYPTYLIKMSEKNNRAELKSL